MRFAPRVVELDPAPDVAGLLLRLRGRSGLLALDSAAGEPRRFSVVACDPLAHADPRTGIAGLRALLARLEPAPGDAVPGPFHGGFLGALAYDLGIEGERQELPPEPWGQPLVIGGLYTDFVVLDERLGRAWLVLGDEPGDSRPPLAQRRATWLALLAAPAPMAPAVHAHSLVRHTPATEHMRRVELLRGAIARGELYQANLAHRFTCALEGEPLDLYLRLRACNPAPYMGLLTFPRGALLSASPELLLELEHGLARTRPIKGTSARSADPRADSASAARLLASAKDRAELAMIVDLERNDLGRIADVGSVMVAGLPTLASYARVHHLMADVVARPRAGCGAFDVLAALFPGGSITGAPKLAAMEWIARLEGHGRGFFCGSLGFADVRGHCAFSILIRTLLWRPGELSFQVGGGITWSSDAAAEERETLHKAAGILDALELSAEAGGRHVDPAAAGEA